MDKILLVYAGFGKGHKKAAQAIGERLSIPGHDILDFTPGIIKKIYPFSYSAATRYFPFIWKTLFSAARNRLCLCLINKIQKKIFQRFIRYLRKTKPRVVITTHFFPIHLAAPLKREWYFKIVAVVTDLGVHPLWVSGEADYYFTALRQTRDDLVNLGVGPGKVCFGTVPLREGFFRTGNRSAPAGTAAGPTVVFIVSLRRDYWFLRKTAEFLLQNFNLTVIYGRSKRTKDYLLSLRSQRIRLFEFYEDIWEIMDSCFVIITKPGGLTVFEGMYTKKPFIFTGYIPGQEKENMDLLLSYKIARFAKNPQELIDGVRYFRENELRIRNNYPVKLEDVTCHLTEVIDGTGDA